ncbi:hypothetical protein ATL42_0680 [Sanguibacter antarcticus]|uniref:Uncharacterized protein n=1 Tax=Sanguibacter antarcticus TaxID=372484 RepID=A0A2A9E3L8_9MICO|nr:hypothetical protein ATL42_0680 [Sanguibacter antarcticus]
MGATTIQRVAADGAASTQSRSAVHVGHCPIGVVAREISAAPAALAAPRARGIRVVHRRSHR